MEPIIGTDELMAKSPFQYDGFNIVLKVSVADSTH